MPNNEELINLTAEEYMIALYNWLRAMYEADQISWGDVELIRLRTRAEIEDRETAELFPLTLDMPFIAYINSHITYEESKEDEVIKEAKERIAQLKKTGEKGIGGLPQWWLEQYKLQPIPTTLPTGQVIPVTERMVIKEERKQALLRFIEKREALLEERKHKRKLAATWRYAPPQPEYAPAFEKILMGLEGRPEPYKDWFARRYSSILAEFEATLPELKSEAWKVTPRYLTRGRKIRELGKEALKKEAMWPGEVERRIEEKLWPEYLETAEAGWREKYATRYPYGEYGRPWAYAPRVKTVGF